MPDRLKELLAVCEAAGTSFETDVRFNLAARDHFPDALKALVKCREALRGEADHVDMILDNNVLDDDLRERLEIIGASIREALAAIEAVGEGGEG